MITTLFKFLTIASVLLVCFCSTALGQSSCFGQMGGNSMPCEGTSSSYFIYSGATGCSFTNSDVTGTTSQRTVSGSQITWHSAGTYTIYFRCSCGTIPKTVTVLSATTSPGTISVSPSGTICPGQTGVTITASSGSIVRWERKLNNESSWTIINHTGNTLGSEYINTNIGGQYRALRNGTCGSTGYSPTATITLTSFNSYLMGGGDTYCHHENATLTLNGSESDATYELLRPDETVFATRPGSGYSLAWENVSILDGSGTYRVRASKSGCSTLMTSGAQVTFVQEAVAHNVSASAGSFCSGGPYPTVNLSGSQENYVYKLYRNGVYTNQSKPGNNQALTFTANAGGDYTIRASYTGCNERLMTGTASITEIVPSVSGGVASVTPSGAVCADGSSSTRTITVSGHSGTVIRWERLLEGESSPTLYPTSSTTFPTEHIIMDRPGEYRALIEGTCNVTDYSFPAQITLEQFSTYFLEGGDEYCYSGNVVLELTGSQSGTAYELIRPDGTVHGTKMHGEGGVIQWIDVNYQDGSGTYWVRGTRGTCTERVTTSGAIVIFSTAPQAKTVTASSSSFCSEGPYPTVNVLNTEDSSITYRLLKDGVYDNQSKPGNSGTLTFTVTEGGRYTVEALRTGCTAVAMDGYADISKLLTPSAPIIGDINQFCGFSIAEKGESGHSNWYWLPNENTFDESNNYETKRIESTSYVYLGAKGSNGCWKVVSQLVTVENIEVNLLVTMEPAQVCQGGKVTLTASGADFYIWHDNAGNVMQENAVLETPTLNGTKAFTVTGYDTKGCFEDVTKSVVVSPEEDLVPKRPFLTKSGNTYTLNKNNTDNTPAGYNYFWQTTPDGVGTDAQSALFPDADPGVYYLRARNSNGCWGPSISIEVPDLTAPVYPADLNMQNVNYVRTYTFQRKDLTIGDPDQLAQADAIITTSYLDGLGRPVQQVTRKGAATGTDLVEPIDYDAFGRSNRRFLAYSALTSTGEVQAQPFLAQRSFYQTAEKVAHSDLPLSYVDYEDSPLNRSNSESAPGETWVGTTGLVDSHTIQNEYTINVPTDSVLMFEVQPAGGLTNEGYYIEEQLVKTVTLDENKNEVIEFKNKSGQVIIKRVKASANEWANTYYVFDDFGHLRFVLPPELMKNIASNVQPYTPSQSELDNFAFQYKYDARKRMTEKKVPGAGWVYMVYDPRDRLVLTQDGNQRAASPYYWTFTKYDQLNRPVITGIKDTAALLTQVEMQDVVNAFYSHLEGQWGESYSDSNRMHGYTNHTYPVFTTDTIADPNHYLTVTYYDNYDFRDRWLGSYAYVDKGLSQTVNGVLYEQPDIPSFALRGQVTGSKTKVLDGGLRGGYIWLKTINYYDQKYRLVQSISDNYKGGDDVTTNLYDFTGKILQSATRHRTNEISWTGLVNTVSVGNTLNKTLISNGWSAGGVTVEQLPAGTDGWIEGIISDPTQTRAFGLTEANEDEHYFTIDYAFWHNSTTARFSENGATVYTFPEMVKPGDVIRIERSGTSMKYYHNGNLVHTTANVSSAALIGDASINTRLGDIIMPRASFASTADSVSRRFVYDHAGRLKETWHQVNGNIEVRIAYNEYNPLGQLVDKKLHSSTGSATNAIQSVDYKYNIRGWLTSMNETDLAAGDPDEAIDYFGFKLVYDEVEAGIGNTPLFNGNISAMQWSTNLGMSDEKVKAYSYSYDAMNRITSATYKAATGTSASLTWTTPADGSFSESGYSYDLNGNILGLVRKGRNGSEMDNLVYDYGAGSAQSNQLLNVTDSFDKSQGFTEMAGEGNDYKYDDNGNLVWDKNKGGEEVLTNGGFSQGSAGWIVTDTGSRLTFENDSLSVNSHTTASATIRQDDILLPRSLYVVIVDVEINSGNIGISLGSSGNTWINSTGKTVFTREAASGNDFVVTIPTAFSGQIKKIEVKGLLVISYNHLNLPEKIVKGLQQSMRYIYDATGRKISQEVYGADGLIVKKTDYEGDFIYENDTLRFVNHEEGRAVISDAASEYQYHLKDHLGNVRLTFTTKPAEDEYTATIEASHLAEETADFPNYDDVTLSSVTMYNHTDEPSATRSVVLNGAPGKQVGLAKSLRVVPGDTVNIEVFAKYFDPASTEGTGTFIADAITSAFGLSSTSIGYEFSAYQSLNSIFSSGWVLGVNDWEDANAPKAFLNYILFDEDFVPYDMGWDQIDISAAVTEQTPNPPHDSLSLQAVVTEPGYVYIYFSNEEQGDIVEVYFDDLRIGHKHGPVIQGDDYYPFGLTFNSYQRENSVDQRWKFQGQEHIDDLGLNWDSFKWRNHQPDIGRFFNIDPLAEKYYYNSPYAFSENKVVAHIEIEGLESIGFNLLLTVAEHAAKIQAASGRLVSGKSGYIPQHVDLDPETRQIVKIASTVKDANTVGQESKALVKEVTKETCNQQTTMHSFWQLGMHNF